MDMTTLKAKAKEKTDQAVGFVRRHRKGLLGALGAVGALGVVAATVNASSKDWDETRDLGENLIESNYEPEKHVSEATECALSETKRPYQWNEDSHLVRGHIRHNSDGSESHVRPYEKVTGGRMNAGAQDGESYVA